MNRTKKKIVRPKNPYATANILSRWSFWWMRHMFRRGLQGPLEDDEVYEQYKNMESEKLTNKFAELWDEERQKKNPSVLRILFNVHGPVLLSIGFIYSLCESLSKALQPLFLGGLVSYFASGQTSVSEQQAYMYALGIVLCVILPVFSFHPFIFFVFQIGIRIRVALSGLIYRKCLRIAKNASNDGLRGRAINIMSNDLSRIDIAMCFLQDLWKGPVESLLIGYLMYLEIGISSVIGVAFMLSFIPLQAFVAKKAAYYRQKTAERTDARVKLMNEIISGIQVIKMYAWEHSFAKLIALVRNKEIHAIRGLTYIYAILSCTSMIAPMSVFLALISYVYLEDALTAKRVYTVSSYFNMLNESMVHFWPLSLTYVAESFVAIRRVKEFLLDGEKGEAPPVKTSKKSKKLLQNGTGLLDDVEEKQKQITRQHNPTAEKKGVFMNNVFATWNVEEKAEPMLKSFNVDIEEGSLAAVVGTVGAGKSTLLNTILGEVNIKSGELQVNGRLSYAAQEPWVFEGTIRDNICFVEAYNERRYKRVLKVCALERDLELLPHGDLTLAGERGVSLSGGQKARINLARAVYRKADIYVLDDPLSAVDAHVGKHIFDRCICEFLGNKTRILVTHQLQYLFDVEKLLLMNEGRLIAQGSYSDLQKSQQFRFLAQSSAHEETELDDTKSTCSRISRTDSERSLDQHLLHADEQPVEDQYKEQQAVGAVKWSAYMSYFQALESKFVLLLIVSLFLITRIMLTGVDYFLSRWVIWEEQISIRRTEAGNVTLLSMNNEETSSNVTAYLSSSPEQEEAQRQQMVIVYASILTATLIIYLLRTFGFFSMCLRIAWHLHDRLFHGITRAPMFFFNTNSSGRILNRFAKDLRTVDTDLPKTLMDCLSFSIDITGVMVIVAIANYWLLVPAAFIIMMLLFLRYIYVNTSRSVKRIEAISRSPIYSLTNQTFQGLTTIRVLEAEKTLESEFHGYVNANSSAWFLFISCTRAFAFWSDMICVLYISAVVFSFLLMSEKFSSGDVGLAILHSTTMIGMCQWGMRQTAELENNMTSVERVLEYTKQPSEPPLESSDDKRPPKGWPSDGDIEFQNLKMRYSAQDEVVLKDINLQIASCEKIGIVGRTGAGKSSIIQSLFRLASNEGVIRIDGLDIAEIGLHDLRSKISIIPQDPVLFSGTLRYNLDPFDLKSDEDMWKALEEVELRKYVSTLPCGLNSHLYDGGSNFSVGQRQLVCLARAILRNNKILILDEATANVDPETDKLIQESIRTKFADCTVLTIAHRLHTVMDCDRVLVMDAGRAVEFAHPYELLQQRGGYLRQLVEHTGLATASVLMQAAEESHKHKFYDSGIERQDFTDTIDQSHHIKSI